MNEAVETPPGEGGPLGVSLGDGLDPAREAAPTPAPAGSARLNRSAFSWALYEGGRDPYVILVIIYIFNPYFATAVVGDPVKGQALVANIAMIYGLMIA